MTVDTSALEEEVGNEVRNEGKKKERKEEKQEGHISGLRTDLPQSDKVQSPTVLLHHQEHHASDGMICMTTHVSGDDLDSMYRQTAHNYLRRILELAHPSACHF